MQVQRGAEVRYGIRTLAQTTGICHQVLNTPVPVIRSGPVIRELESYGPDGSGKGREVLGWYWFA